MNKQHQAYWRANLRLICSLLIIWFVVPFLGGIVFVEQLNEIRLGGYKLGFWIAQQGAIYVFVVMIFFYAWRVNKLEEQYLDQDRKQHPNQDPNQEKGEAE